MPVASELIGSGRSVEEINNFIGSDKLIFQDLDDLKSAIKKQNPNITDLECSIFDGIYITLGVDAKYFEFLANLRSEDAKKIENKKEEIADLEMYNEL